MTFPPIVDEWQKKIADIDGARKGIISKLRECGQSVPSDEEQIAAGKEPVRLHEILTYLQENSSS